MTSQQPFPDPNPAKHQEPPEYDEDLGDKDDKDEHDAAKEASRKDDTIA